VYIRVYSISKSVRISEEFHDRIKAHNRDDETMEDTLRRLIGGPSPEEVAGIISDETAEGMREAIKAKSKNASDKRKRVAERMADDS
jgi:intergrase/recombinase